MNMKNMFMAQGLVLHILQELVRSGEVPLSPQNLEVQIRPKVFFCAQVVLSPVYNLIRISKTDSIQKSFSIGNI